MSLHYDGEVKIKKLELGWFGANAYVVVCPRTGESVIIDTPTDAHRILDAAQGTRVRCILITHNHMDHLGALAEVQGSTGAPVGVHPIDGGALPLPYELALSDGDQVQFGTLALKVIQTPGHTPGSICLLCGKHLFSGDTLFPGGPGKTGSPHTFAQIIESITSRLFPLPEETAVYPGHGPDTTVGRSKEEYAVFARRPHDPGLCGDVLWLES